jgi:hypothetical protein
MQIPVHLGWETRFIQAIRIHLNVVIPVATLSVKILVRVFSRDEISEIFRSLTNLPLELMLIAMSFILGALSGLSQSYVARFQNQSDADLFAVLTIIAMFFLSVLINRLTRFVRILSGKLYVAFKQYREFAAQPAIPGTVSNVAIGGRILWAMAYCILMVVVLTFTFGISIGTLAYVLHLIQ